MPSLATRAAWWRTSPRAPAWAHRACLATSTPPTARSAPLADRRGLALETRRSATSWRWKAYAVAASWTPLSLPLFTTRATASLRPLRLSAQRTERVPPESVRGAQLDSNSQYLRHSGPGPAPARADVESGSRFPAHLQRACPVDHQSVHPQGPVQLLCQPRPLRRYPIHAESEYENPALGHQKRFSAIVRPTRPEERDRHEADPAGEFRFRYYRPDVQPGLCGRQRR